MNLMIHGAIYFLGIATDKLKEKKAKAHCINFQFSNTVSEPCNASVLLYVLSSCPMLLQA
jgi:hypothetical protein